MKRKMLINAQRAEELRVAIISDGTLDTYEVAAAASGLCRGNIYRGLVAKPQPSLSAAFVEYGAERHGLLRADDIMPAAALRKGDNHQRRAPIEQLVEKGQQVLVQVVRDAVGTKGALLTTNISIAGRYLVLMPFEDVRGISRKLEDDETRQKVRERVAELNVPEGFGVIVRTNAIDQPKKDLNRDLNALLRLWKKIRSEASVGRGTRLLYSDQDLLVQALRDFLDSTIEEVLVDNDQAHAKAQGYMKSFMPRAKTRLVRYDERMPLFSRFRLEEQIESIYLRRVELPSGGSVVIDPTEALTAIDVNSGRATRGGSQEETAHASNLEAAREVARQLRLRDIGGLVVVDFIDMRSAKHRRDIEKTMRESMKDDRARFTVGRLSPNGLLEINRQRLKKALQLRTHRPCPTCGGAGSIASPELIGLNLLRRIETRAVTGSLKGVRVALHPELADAFQNDHRQEIADLEQEFDIRIEIIAATSLHRSEERIDWSQREGGDRAETHGRQGPVVSAADLATDEGGGRRAKKETAPEIPASKAESEEAEPTAVERKSRRRRRGGRRRKKTTSAGTNDSAKQS